MCGRVQAKLCINTGQLTDEHSKARAVPAAIVGEIGPDFPMGGNGGVYPNGYYKGKVGNDVNDKGNVLPEMEYFVAENVSAESYTDCGDDEEGSMPFGKCVGLISKGDERLDNSAHEENTCRVGLGTQSLHLTR